MENTLLVNTGGVVGEAVLLRAQPVTFLHRGPLAPGWREGLQCSMRGQRDAVAGAVVADILVRAVNKPSRSFHSARRRQPVGLSYDISNGVSISCLLTVK